MAYRLDSLKSFRLATYVAATTTLGAGANGVVTLTSDLVGGIGNTYTIQVVAGTGNNSALAATKTGTAYLVTLATDGSGAPNDAANTATLIAAALDALAGITATASGDGSTAISTSVAVKNFASGRDAYTRADVAKMSNVSDWVVKQLEGGGAVSQDEAQRIADALGTNLSTLGGAAL